MDTEQDSSPRLSTGRLQQSLYYFHPLRNTATKNSSGSPTQAKGGSKREGKKHVEKKECIIRESNTGLIDGNDEFYH